MGHSHITALHAAWRERAIYVNVPENIVTVLQYPISADYWETAVAAAEGRVVVALLTGNQHNSLFLFDSDPPFRCLPISAPGLPIEDGAQLISFEMAVSCFSETLEPLRHLLPRFTSARQLVMVGTPPPKPDHAVRRWLTTEDDFARKLAEGNEAAPITPLSTRVALWEALQEAMTLLCTDLDVPFLPVPDGVQDREGALKEEYWSHDVTHANGRYGAVVWDAIVSSGVTAL
jgi:hypothetical protein